jgi:hypothetical protein
VLTRDDVCEKSPGDGLAPSELGTVLGRRLLAPLAQDANVDPRLLEAERAEALG